MRKNIYDDDVEENIVSGLVIGAAIEVHRNLGPGLLESAYSSALAYEMTLRGIPFEKEKPVPVVYKGQCLDTGFRLDFLVRNIVVVELKSVQEIIPIHTAQVMNYLKLTHCRLGLLINFNVDVLHKNVHRVANGLPESSPKRQIYRR